MHRRIGRAQQRVEILKMLYRNAEVLIFDEPTAVLTPQEIQDFLGILRNLISEGKSIILITHKLKEIKAIADRHGVSMKAAGLQFSLANPAVAAVIPGASRPSRIAEDRAALEEAVPANFWRELREAGLVNPAAPLPDAD